MVVFLVRDQKIHGIERNIKEPGKVGQNKYFAEGDHVICRHMDDVKVKPVPAFDQKENGKIAGCKDHHGDCDAEFPEDHTLPYTCMFGMCIHCYLI